MDKENKTSAKHMAKTNRYRRKHWDEVKVQDFYRNAERFLTEVVEDLDDVRMYQEAIKDRRRELKGEW